MQKLKDLSATPDAKEMGPLSHLILQQCLCGTAVALNGIRAEDAAFIYLAAVLMPRAGPSMVPLGKGGRRRETVKHEKSEEGVE